ncbi:MAG: serine/threonine protein kinase [Candidatus Sericytochromatia bacterium]|nr:MAG: serine/threonine protein kinase [Candidatus Sericytochromatia bacterium]
MKILDYEIVYKLFDNNYFSVIRLYDNSKNRYFILKTIKDEKKFYKLENENLILKSINSDFFLKPVFLNKNYLLFQDFNGITLKEYINKNNIALEDFLIISIKIVNAISDLHKNNIAHYNLNPYNILINNNKDIKVFGLENSNKTNVNDLSITISSIDLKYVSPEQTGRFNYPIDYKSDFYSLGIIFYEMITGKLPFYSNDQMELIHYHIAQNPDITSNIPKTLSKIINKLLSKYPNDRYKNCYGIEYDLKKSLESIKNKGFIEEFEIAKYDINPKIQFPEKIYGRDEELLLITKSLEKFKKGNLEIVLVSGDSGMGKSSLIDKVSEEIKKQNIYYIYSKFDNLTQNKPYSSFIDGIRILIKRILSESNEKLNQFKYNLINKLGSSLNILIDLIPEIKLIVGKNFISIVKNEETEIYDNLNNILIKFIFLFIEDNNLLTIRFDDLQWIDQATFNFIKTLIFTNNIKNLFLICTYRENEISEAVKDFINEIKNAHLSLREIKLNPINVYSLCEILSDIFSLPIEKVSNLANVLINKTGGNPFFIQHFINSLSENQIIKFDKNNQWTWDIDKINELEGTENLISIVMNRIHSLNKETFEILKTAAFIGNNFNLDLLSFIFNKNNNEIKNIIYEAIKQNITIISENYFKFIHDKIQDIIYNSFSEQEKKLLHYKIGKLLLNNVSKEHLDIYLFEIVNQLNLSYELIKDYNEKYNFAILNFKSGQKAKKALAFSLALKYFSMSLKIFEKEDWVKDYNILFSLYTELAHCHYFLSNFEKSEKLLLKVYKKTNNNLDKAILCEKLAFLYLSMNKLKTSIEYSINGLRFLGTNISFGIKNLETYLYYFFIKRKIQKINFLDFEKNINNDFKYILKLSLYSALITASYMHDRQLMFLAILKMFKSVLKNGSNYYSSFSFISLAVLLDSKNINNSEIIHEARKLGETFENNVMKMRLNFIYACLINPWRNHLKSSIDILSINSKFNVDNSDPIYYSYSINYILLYLFLIGNNIDDIYNKIEIYSEKIYKINNPDSIDIFTLTKQLILNLKGMTYNFVSLSDDNFNEELFFKDLKKKKNYTTIAIAHFIKMLIFFLLGNYDKALEHAEEFEKNKDFLLGNILIAEFLFYYSLILIAKFSKSPNIIFKRYLKIIKNNQKQLKQFSEKCVSNFLAKYYLVDAELKRIKKDNEGALALYKKSIELADKYNYINIKAIANELVAKFMIYQGKNQEAREYISNSYNDFNFLGAKSKVLDIEKKYSYYLYHINYRSTSNTGNLQINEDIELDLNTIMKAYQALSEEVFLDKLISKYMKIVIENAGAQKGYLILNQNSKFVVISEYTINSREATIFEGIDLNEFDYLAKSVVNYVQRTNKEIIIDDAYNDVIFLSDKYILENKPKSIICIPILKQQELLGILYLENNLTLGAFTYNRVKLLKLVSSQLAISLENAKLYNDMRNLNIKLEENKTILEETVNRRTKELKLTQRKLIENAYTSGIAEITTGLLHNIGNVLNSINVSNQIINDIISNSKINGLIKANNLLRENINNLENFILNNEKGRKLLEYYLKIGDSLLKENEDLKKEIKLLSEKIFLIKNIINTQQSYAKKDFMIESVYIENIIEDVLSMHYETLTKENINVIKKYSKTPKINIQKSKVLSILFNLIKNARDALVDTKEKIIEIRTIVKDNYVVLSFTDNGIGIDKENLNKIFTHGFTTKKNGHGFGLHTCANAMTEMNGKIAVESEGKNKGATFHLYFPI